MDIVFSIIKVIFLFGITIFVHELGHFIVARRLGLKAEVFSIGFGPAIWKKKHNGVLYKVGVLPFGGYVALPQMDPSGGLLQKGEDGEPLPNPAPWKKILVAVAGVACNLVLAYVLAWIVFLGGKSYAPTEEGCILGYVETNSTAYAEGLRIGDRILDVEGLTRDGEQLNAEAKAVADWDAFTLATAFSDEVRLHVVSVDGRERYLDLPTEPFMGARFAPGIVGLNYCYVLQVGEGTSAQEAGLEPGDKLLVLDGVKLYSREQLMHVVNERADQVVPLQFDRSGEILDTMVRPKYDEGEKRALIGITFNTLDVKKPWAQVKSHASLIFRFLGALMSPKDAGAAAKGVGGPIYIFAMFWYAVRSDFIVALWLTGLFNVNLAVLNLLPIPILDGGHIVFAALEGIRRKPLSAKLVGALSNVFFVLLLGLLLLLSYRDVVRLPIISRMNKATPPAEQVTNDIPAEATPTE